MPRFLLEVEHKATKEACKRAQMTFYRTGSHFMTHADWGCSDDVHKAWMIVELPSREDALSIIPPDFRKKTNVVELELMDPSQMEELIEHHED
jgi:hypothetical protein